MNPSPGTRIFLSYSQADRDLAQRLSSTLHDFLPHTSIFLDYSSINPGDNWVTALSNSILSSDIFIILITDTVPRSQWTGFELGLALSKRENSNKPLIIPILFGSPSQIPAILRHLQFVDFREEKAFKENVARIAKTIDRISAEPEERANSPLDKGELETFYIKTQHYQLDELKSRQNILERYYYRDGVRKAIISLLFAIFSIDIIVTISSIFYSKNSAIAPIAKDWMQIFIAPTTALLGAACGFYFGQRSVLESVEDDGTLSKGDQDKSRSGSGQ